MFETIIVILLCILLLSGIGDLFFDALGFGVRLFLSIILVVASAYLAVKLLFAMIPWMFGISVAAFVIGIIWLIYTVAKRL